MIRLLPVYWPLKRARDTEACKNNRRPQSDTNPQVNLNVAFDRHMLLHVVSILNQAHHVTKLVVDAMTVQYVQLKNGRKHFRTVTSTGAKAPGWGAFTSLLLPIRSSIAG